jgi:3-oxoadipate enol-lactonase/4-carboxymuconolactone decarboxylase
MAHAMTHAAFVETRGVRLHYRIDGEDGAPPLLLCNSLGTDLHMWDAQVPEFARRFRVIRYDGRGHGQSGIPHSPSTLTELGEDVIDLLAALDIERVRFCGLSLGGLVGQWLALHAPGRIERMVLASTNARFGTPESWNARISQVEREGIEGIADATLGRWFSPGFRQREPEVVEGVRRQLLATSKLGYTSCCAALRDADLRTLVARIAVPTLVIVGEEDPVSTPADARWLAEQIPAARYAILRGAHLCNLEDAGTFTDVALSFLGGGVELGDERERYATGIATRRAVLGNAHVDRAVARLNPFNQEFQDLITRYAWGEIWSRPGLPRHTRSLLTISMMVALRLDAELKLHLRAAGNNGVSREEIKEVLLQSAIYCGVPAAHAAFRAAEEVFAEADAQAQGERTPAHEHADEHEHERDDAASRNA